MQRLFESPIDDVMEPISGDLGVWAKLASDTRNYYTHYDPEGEAKAAKGIDLYRTVQRLQVLVGALLLHASDLDATVLIELFSNNQHYLFLRRVQAGVET